MSAATNGKSDALFWREFGIILALLTAFFIAMVILARVVGGAALDRMANAEPDVLARIAPVTKVRVGDPSAATEATAVAVAGAGGADAAAQSGEQVYNTACSACHAAGVAGAPKFGDKAAWEPRASLGIDVLVQSVINGKGAMPAKAGNPSLTEDGIKRSIAFMLEKADLAVDGVSSEAPAAAGAAPAAPAAPAADAPAADAPAKSAAAPAQMPAAAAAAPAADSVDLAAGEATYGQACVACHATGAANAPKLGDKAAWEPRLAQGVNGLMNSVVNGKGAMPAKGGFSALTDAEIQNAIMYMLNKTGVTAGG